MTAYSSLRIAIYARVSTDEQDPEDQLRECSDCFAKPVGRPLMR